MPGIYIISPFHIVGERETFLCNTQRGNNSVLPVLQIVKSIEEKTILILLQTALEMLESGNALIIHTLE